MIDFSWALVETSVFTDQGRHWVETFWDVSVYVDDDFQSKTYSAGLRWRHTQKDSDSSIVPAQFNVYAEKRVKEGVVSDAKVLLRWPASGTGVVVNKPFIADCNMLAPFVLLKHQDKIEKLLKIRVKKLLNED